MFVSKTFVISDRILYTKLTSRPSYLSGTANQLSFSNDGMYLKSSVWSYVSFNVPFTKGVEISFLAKSMNSSGHANYFNIKEENASTNLYGGTIKNDVWYVDKPTPSASGNISGDKNVKIELESDGTVKLYINNTLVNTKSISTSSNLIFYFGTGTSSYATITDLSIKPL